MKGTETAGRVLVMLCPGTSNKESPDMKGTETRKTLQQTEQWEPNKESPDMKGTETTPEQFRDGWVSYKQREPRHEGD